MRNATPDTYPADRVPLMVTLFCAGIALVLFAYVLASAVM